MTHPPLELEHDLEVRRSTYEWSVRLFRVLQKVLKVNVKLHHSEGQIDEGEIFLFNHFARFETFIPQYLIYRETGAMSRSVAGAGFFANEDAFTTYLLNAGAVPNNLPDLLPFLAVEVLRGRKIIVFPEGGMVKDRRSTSEDNTACTRVKPKSVASTTPAPRCWDWPSMYSNARC